MSDRIPKSTQVPRSYSSTDVDAPLTPRDQVPSVRAQGPAYPAFGQEGSPAPSRRAGGFFHIAPASEEPPSPPSSPDNSLAALPKRNGRRLDPRGDRRAAGVARGLQPAGGLQLQSAPRATQAFVDLTASDGEEAIEEDHDDDGEDIVYYDKDGLDEDLQAEAKSNEEEKKKRDRGNAFDPEDEEDLSKKPSKRTCCMCGVAATVVHVMPISEWWMCAECYRCMFEYHCNGCKQLTAVCDLYGVCKP